jgi:hypothetical protein
VGGGHEPARSISLTSQTLECWSNDRSQGATKPKHIWAIRQHLKSIGSIGDLAMFNIALDAKLRGCDLVKLRLGDVAPGSVVRQRSIVIQQKTGRPCRSRSPRPQEKRWRNGSIAEGDGVMTGCSQPQQRRSSQWHPTVCSPGRRLGKNDRPELERLWHPQPSTDKGGLDLQEERQPARLPTPARPREAREHRPLSRLWGSPPESGHAGRLSGVGRSPSNF